MQPRPILVGRKRVLRISEGRYRSSHSTNGLSVLFFSSKVPTHSSSSSFVAGYYPLLIESGPISTWVERRRRSNKPQPNRREGKPLPKKKQPLSFFCPGTVSLHICTLLNSLAQMMHWHVLQTSLSLCVCFFSFFFFLSSS